MMLTTNLTQLTTTWLDINHSTTSVKSSSVAKLPWPNFWKTQKWRTSLITTNNLRWKNCIQSYSLMMVKLPSILRKIICVSQGKISTDYWIKKSRYPVGIYAIWKVDCWERHSRSRGNRNRRSNMLKSVSIIRRNDNVKKSPSSKKSNYKNNDKDLSARTNENTSWSSKVNMNPLHAKK